MTTKCTTSAPDTVDKPDVSDMTCNDTTDNYRLKINHNQIYQQRCQNAE